MIWISVAKRLPERTPTETFYGGNISDAVLGLFPDDSDQAPGLNIRPCFCVYFDEYGERGEENHIEWYISIGQGGFDRCSSHGGKNPTHWMPLPEAPK